MATRGEGGTGTATHSPNPNPNHNHNHNHKHNHNPSPCLSPNQALRHIFAYFAGVNEAGTALLSKKARMAAETMNVTECHELCEAAGLYTSDEKNEFTIRENLVAFVKVNLDDDLYYQQEEGNTASELVYEEFEEWLVRIFAASVWEALVESGARRPSLLVAVDGDGDGELDDDDIDELFDECDANPSKP